jgi:hypothetical protein
MEWLVVISFGVSSFVTLARRVIGASQVRRWRFDQLLRAGYPAGGRFRAQRPK